MKDIKKFISCSCNSETIVLEKFKNEDEIYLSIFGRGLNVKRYNWKDKLRHIFHILKHGFPYTDEIVLNKLTAKELIKALTSLCK